MALVVNEDLSVAVWLRKEISDSKKPRSKNTTYWNLNELKIYFLEN